MLPGTPWEPAGTAGISCVGSQTGRRFARRMLDDYLLYVGDPPRR